jgi:hypothetical protein
MTNRTPIATAPVPTEPSAADELEALAQLAGRLRPDWRGDIWAYYQARSDLISRLRRLARWARAQEVEREAGSK